MLRIDAKRKRCNSSSSSSKDAVHLLLQKAQCAHGLRPVLINSMINMRHRCLPLWFMAPLVHGQRQLTWRNPTFKKVPSSNALPFEHSRHSSLSPNEPLSDSNERGHSRHSNPALGGAPKGYFIQPLSHRPSTCPGLSRHAGSDSPGARRPATVDPTAL